MKSFLLPESTHKSQEEMRVTTQESHLISQPLTGNPTTTFSHLSSAKSSRLPSRKSKPLLENDIKIIMISSLHRGSEDYRFEYVASSHTPSYDTKPHAPSSISKRCFLAQHSVQRPRRSRQRNHVKEIGKSIAISHRSSDLTLGKATAMCIQKQLTYFIVTAHEILLGDTAVVFQSHAKNIRRLQNIFPWMA